MRQPQAPSQAQGASEAGSVSATFKVQVASAEPGPQSPAGRLNEGYRASSAVPFGTQTPSGYNRPTHHTILRTNYQGHLLLACMLGRLWGSLQLAIHAGVDVPVMWHGLYREKQRHSLLVAQPDMRMRWVMGELSHLVDTFTFQWVRQRGTRGWKKSLENLSKFLHPKDLGSFGTDVLRMGDPLPFAYEVQKTVRKVIKQKADRLIDETSFVRPLSLPTNLKVQSEK